MQSETQRSPGRLIKIPARGVRSLVWRGDELVDIVGGGIRYALDGSSTGGFVNYAFTFDRATTSPSGDFSVIYTDLGTKALVLRRDGSIVREVDRSFYFADRYEYPMALATVDGRDLLVHCPRSYCRIEIEEVESGKVLTERDSKPSKDFFHSRLAVSPDGRYLLSAGWFWRPYSGLLGYDINEALRRPEHLDEPGLVGWDDFESEVGSTAFLGSDCVVVAAAVEDPRDEDEPETGPLPRELGLWSIAENRWLSRVNVDGPIGTIMAIDRTSCLSLYEHPKLIDLATGEVTASWPEIESGTQVDSFVTDRMDVPPTALDPAHRRFAIASAETITVVDLT